MRATRATRLLVPKNEITRPSHRKPLSHPSPKPGEAAQSFRGYYDSREYFASVRVLVAVALRGAQLLAPDGYMPPVFGQSVAGDGYCVAWTLMFLRGATREGPEAWAVRAARLSAEELRAEVRAAVKELAGARQTAFRLEY